MTLEQIRSVLQMTNLFVKKCSFTRNVDVINGKRLEIEFKRGKQQISETIYNIALETTINCENNDFSLDILVNGVFDVSNVPDTYREEILDKNTFAIIFPFVRSQITLMTSQPGMQPIVLPAININSMIAQATEITED